jgi:hypothetical protein
MVYVNELQHLWAELDQCDPLESMELAMNWLAINWVEPKLASLDEAIDAMSKEETRLQFKRENGNKSTSSV